MKETTRNILIRCNILNTHMFVMLSSSSRFAERHLSKTATINTRTLRKEPSDRLSFLIIRETNTPAPGKELKEEQYAQTRTDIFGSFTRKKIYIRAKSLQYVRRVSRLPEN